MIVPSGYFDPEKVVQNTFTFFTDSLRADFDGLGRPDPPPALRAVAGAKNRRDALERVMRGSSFLPIDKEALAERGEFVPRSLIAGKTYEESLGGVPDLSEAGPEGDEG